MSAVAPGANGWALPSRGRVGMALLILTESAFFVTFLVAYLFYIGKSPTGPTPRGVLERPILNTVCLLSSSLTAVLATQHLVRGQIGRFRLWLLVTILLGTEFIVGTGIEWRHLIEAQGLWIDTNLFGTTFYSLVGFHALHVTIGLVLLALIFGLCLGGFVGPADAERVEMVSWYWHFVDGVWVFVFAVVYVVGM